MTGFILAVIVGAPAALNAFTASNTRAPALVIGLPYIFEIRRVLVARPEIRPLDDLAFAFFSAFGADTIADSHLKPKRINFGGCGGPRPPWRQIQP